MATISTRINSSGTYLVNGTFDEITYNRTSPVIKNLVQYTEQLDNAYWILNDLLPVTANATIAPDGTLTADKVTENTAASITHFIRSTGVLISSSTQYTWSIYAKAGERTFIDVALGTASFWVNSSRSATFNLTTGAIVAVSPSPLVASITPAGNGWYRCSITATSASTPGMSSNGSVRLCNASASNTYNGDGVSGVFLWGGQLEQNSTTTIYQGIAAASTLVTPTFKNKVTSDAVYVTDIFDEVTYNTASPAIKNLFKYTETFNFDYTNWTLNGGTMTQNATLAPDGKSLAPKLVELASLGNQRIYNWMPVTAGTTYTYSIFLKAAERYIVRCYFEDVQSGGGGRVGQYLNLQTGTVISTYLTGFNTLLGSNLQFVGNGWYRFSWTVTAQLSAALNSTAFMIIGMADSGSNFNYTGNGTSGMYIWGAQMEVSNAVTDYQGIAAANTLVAPGFAKRDTSVGTSYVTGAFDEVTGVPIIDSSVVLWLDPAQPTSYPGIGTTWVDLSTSNNTGTLTSASTFDRIEGAGSFNFAITNYATLATNLVPSGSRTIVMAFKTTDITTRAGVISARDGAGGWFVCLNRAGGGNFTYSLNNVPVNNDLQATNAITQTNTWYIAVITHDDVSDVGKIYINGNLIVSATMGEILPVGSLNSYVGREINSGNNFPGWIGSVIVYNRALTEDEATQNFNALRRRYGI